MRWVLLVVGLAGCSSILGLSKPKEESDGGGSAQDGDFTVHVNTPNPRVPQNGFDFIDVQVVRGDGFDAAVDVDLGPTPPAGVTATKVTVPAGQTIAHLAVNGDSTLVPGQTVDLVVTGVGTGAHGKLTHTADVTANITIKPGSIDTTFGTSGLASHEYDNRGNDLTDVSVQSDGTIVGVGRSQSELSGNGNIMVLDGNGAFLSTFNPADPSGDPAGTRKFHASGSSAPTGLFAMSRHTSGPLVFVGQGHGTSPAAQNPLLMFVNADGSDVVGFPFVINVFNDGSSAVGAQTITGGSVVLLLHDQSNTTSFLFRVKSDGKEDFAFGDEHDLAMVTAGAHAMKVDLADGTQPIYVAGTVLEASGTTHDIKISRFLENANPDTGWGGSGTITIGDAGVDETTMAIAVTATSVFVVGSANGEFFLRKLKKDGTVDTAFGTNGVASPAITDGNDVPADLAVQADGKILVVGNALDGTKMGPIVVRYLPDGTLDPTYGTAGVASLFIGTNGEFSAVDLAANGDAIVSGGFDGDKDDTAAIITRLGF